MSCALNQGCSKINSVELENNDQEADEFCLIAGPHPDLGGAVFSRLEWALKQGMCR